MINLNGERRGIAVYNRFEQSYILDFFNFHEGESEHRVDNAFSVFFTRDFQSMNILGIDSSENESLFLTQVDIKTTKIKIYNPHKYIGNQFKFEAEFLNNKTIEMNFTIKNANDLNFNKSRHKSAFVICMEAMLIIMSVLILIALALLIKVMRDKGSEYMATRTMMTETARVDQMISESKLRSREKDFNMGDL